MVEVAVIAVFVMTTAAQVSISTTLVFVLVAILVAALAGTLRSPSGSAAARSLASSRPGAT